MKPARPQGPHIPIGGSYEKKTNKIILVEGRALSACSSSFQKGKALEKSTTTFPSGKVCLEETDS